MCDESSRQPPDAHERESADGRRLFSSESLILLHMKIPDLTSEEVIALCEKYDVRTLSLFGSVSRGAAGPGSDIDLLVSFSRPVTLLHLVALERELSAILRRKVDLVTEASLSPYLRRRILRQRRQVYAA
jgi:hypothetical protein